MGSNCKDFPGFRPVPPGLIPDQQPGKNRQPQEQPKRDEDEGRSGHEATGYRDGQMPVAQRRGRASGRAAGRAPGLV